MSLQCKSVVFVAILILCVTGAVSLYLVQTSASFVMNRQNEQMIQLAGMLAQAAANIAEDDIHAVETLANRTANGSPMIYAVFTDASGRRVAAAEHGPLNIIDLLDKTAEERPSVIGVPTFHPRLGSLSGVLDISVPIRTRPVPGDSPTPGSGRLIGYVRAGMLASGWHRALASRLDLLIGVGVFVAVVAIPLGFLLIRRIVSPLEELSAVMRRFTDGDWSVRSNIHRRDEIGKLAQTFNHMADQHEEAHNRMVELHAGLEKRVEERTIQLRELAAREPLTGLYNRRHFQEVLETRFAEAVRYDTDLSCLMIDLDHFKSVNDSFGHHVGDDVLVTAARIITSQLRSSDLAARFGGDEFIVLLPQTGSDRARSLAERISSSFRAAISEKFPRARVSMGIGIASLHSMRVSDPELLIRATDRALYEAKAAGVDHIINASEPAVRA